MREAMTSKRVAARRSETVATRGARSVLHWAVAGAITMVWLLPGTPARATEDEPVFGAQSAEDKTTTFSDMIQEIIVTARKREERIQGVPVAVTAITGEDTVRRNLRRLDNLDGVVPNLLLTQSLDRGNSGRIAIRGIGQGEPTSTADPAVGVYLDGVYLSRFQGALVNLVDIDRVEVLRGPQGTLFGKNTVGGAINIVSARPDFEFGGTGEIRIGNFDLLETRLSLNVPLVPEKVAARLNLATATRDGFVKNVANGDEYADNKLLGGRLQLLALPTENTEVLLTLDRAREDRKPRGSKCVFLGSNNTVSGQIATLSGFAQQCQEDAARSDFKFASNETFAEDKLETTGATAQVMVELTPQMSLRSITSWRRQETVFLSDADGTLIPLLDDTERGGRDVQSQYSQEFQLTGRAMDGRLRYVLGLFGLKEDVRERDGFGPGLFLADASGNVLLGPNVMGVGVGVLPLRERVLKVDNLSYAAYAQVSYAVTDRLDLTLGLRRTQERKRALRREVFTSCNTRPLGPEVMNVIVPDCNPALIANLPAVEFPFFESSARFGDWSPMATLAYTVNPDVLLYASYGTAFRSGGFNGIATRAQDVQEIDPEDLTSYEIGLKSTFFDGRARLNLAGFYNIVEDFRVPFTDFSQLTGLAAVTQGEASKIILRGGEIEGAVVVMPGLQLSANIGILRGKYEKFDVPSPSLSEDERIPDAPNYTMDFTVDYQRPLGTLGDMGLTLNWVHRGSNLNDFQGTDALEVDKVGLLNGRLALQLPDGKSTVALFGTNLLNREYFDNGLSLEDAFGYALRYYAPPRFYGLEVRREF